MNRKNNLLLAMLLSSVSFASFAADYTYSNGLKIDLVNDTADILVKNNKPILKVNKKDVSNISHIIFNEFNVGKKGLTIDNTIGSDYIINEVIGNAKSMLSGNIRVSGKNANITLVNPNGIVCLSCNFTNANTITLAAKKLLDDKEHIDLNAISVYDFTGNGSTITIKNTKSILNDLRLIARNISIHKSNITANNITLQHHVVNNYDSNGIKGTFSVSSDTKLNTNSFIVEQQHSKFINNGIISGNSLLTLAQSDFENNGKMSGDSLTANLKFSVSISGKNGMTFDKWEMNDLDQGALHNFIYKKTIY